MCPVAWVRFEKNWICVVQTAELISPARFGTSVEETDVVLAPVRRRLWNKTAVPLLAIEDKRPDEAIVELPSMEEPFAPVDEEPFAPDGVDEDPADAEADAMAPHAHAQS